MIDYFHIQPAVNLEDETCMHVTVLTLFIKAADWCTCNAGATCEVGATDIVCTAALHCMELQ